MKYRITPKADEDLKSIARYTYRTWGIKQRNAYIALLRRRVAWLSQNPRLGTLRGEIREGLLSYPVGEHLIFYLIEVDHISIVGVPHKQMDMATYFAPN